MNQTEIFKLANDFPMFHLATMEGNEPRVRALLLYRADDNGLIFHTGKFKPLHKQLQANPSVEMCFNNYKDGIQVRVRGKVELLEDLALKKEIVEKRAFLKPWVEKNGYEPLAVYRLNKGLATVWTMATNFGPSTYIEL